MGPGETIGLIAVAGVLVDQLVHGELVMFTRGGGPADRELFVTALQGGDLGFLLAGVFAHVPGALADDGYGGVAEFERTHGRLLQSGEGGLLSFRVLWRVKPTRVDIDLNNQSIHQKNKINK